MTRPSKAATPTLTPVGQRPAPRTDDLPRRDPPGRPAPAPPTDQGGFPASAFGDVVDRTIHASLARLTLGLSPAALAASYLDWATHLALSPGKQAEIVRKGTQKWARLARFAATCALRGDSAPCIAPLPNDRRFAGEAWQKWPYNLIWQGFLLRQQWWHNATTGVRGVTPQHEAAVEFAARQMLDVFAPSNFLPTNPELQEKTLKEGGMNFVRGLGNLIEDAERAFTGRGPVGSEDFRVGRDVAVTPGKVVYRNRLIELIQYAPATPAVRPEPVLIVPAWIMKYYILDLSPHNSLVRYLTGQGHTVFIVSWKNPTEADRDLGMEDYLRLGLFEALDAVEAIVPGQGVHAAGYCLGGTLLAIAAARLARTRPDRLATITLLAAQTDFEEAGELMLFMNESQVTFLEDMMWAQGMLDARQMAGAFQLLRSNDLIWSRNLREYLMGERQPMTDLMAWNADATRMPYRMHSEYLRSLYLDNDLAEGRYRVGGQTVSLDDIRAPIFAVGTTADHVAPWRSVFKIERLTRTDTTFLLTSGGHNAGIVSEPGRDGRTYRLRETLADEPFRDAESWAAGTEAREGSWWPEWAGWLARRSGPPALPPRMGALDRGYAPLEDAPGTYVLAG